MHFLVVLSSCTFSSVSINYRRVFNVINQVDERLLRCCPFQIDFFVICHFSNENYPHPRNRIAIKEMELTKMTNTFIYHGITVFQSNVINYILIWFARNLMNILQCQKNVDARCFATKRTKHVCLIGFPPTKLIQSFESIIHLFLADHVYVSDSSSHLLCIDTIQ